MSLGADWKRNATSRITNHGSHPHFFTLGPFQKGENLSLSTGFSGRKMQYVGNATVLGFTQHKPRFELFQPMPEF